MSIDLELQVRVPHDGEAPIFIGNRLYGLSMAYVQRATIGTLGSEWDEPGVYLLLTPSRLGGTFRIYVGKAGELGVRVRQHVHSATRAWDSALLVKRAHVDGFTSAEYAWLEGRLHEVLSKRGTALDNIAIPGDRTVSSSLAAELEHLVGPIQKTLRLLGHDQRPDIALASQLENDDVEVQQRGQLPDLKADLTFNEALARYIPTLRTENTRDRYGRELRRLAAEVAPKRPSQLTRDDCEEFLKAWANSSPKTLALQITILSAFFDWMVRDHRIYNSPMLHVRRPRTEAMHTQPIRVLTVKEVATLLDECRTWPERLCLAVLIHTGARRDAAATLRWRDVDVDRGLLRLGGEKGAVLEMTLPEELATLLRKFLAENDPSPNDFVIPNKRPTRYPKGTRSPRIVYVIADDVAKRTGIEAYPESFRAFYASEYIRTHGSDLVGLQRQLGHSRIEVTARFLQRAGLQV